MYLNKIIDTITLPKCFLCQLLIFKLLEGKRWVIRNLAYEAR